MIVVDVRALQSAAHAERGIGRYVFELARALTLEHPGVVDAFAVRDPSADTPRLHELAALGAPLAAYAELAGRTVDVLHVTSPFDGDEAAPALADAFAPVAARRLVVSCYDLIPYRFAEHYLADPAPAARYRSRLGLLAVADAVVADSHATAHDLVELIGLDRRRISVVGAGVGDQFVPPTASPAQRIAALQTALPALRPGFVLAPVGMDWRKNVERMIAAFARLPADVGQRQLVLGCAVTPGYAAWLELLATQAGIADRVLVTGHVDDATLVGLYQTAAVVCVPSLYEGFGLPALEALHCGATVICSDVSSLPEVVRDPRARFDPYDIDDIAARLAAALGPEAVGARFGDVPGGGYSWSATAAAVADVYHAVCAVTPTAGSVAC